MGKLLIQLLLSFTLFIIPISSQEVEHEKEFDYQHPKDWGKIHPEWGTCENGTMQSPIDLLNAKVKLISQCGPGELQRHYKPANATLKNRGHDMMLEWDSSGAGTININGTEYVLRQCHWHSPTEHTIKGKSYALEQHLVHVSKDGKYAVIGIMYTMGSPDPFLTSLSQELFMVAGIKREELEIGLVDPNDINIDTQSFYRYTGSLTIPPCTENVIWTILKKMKTVTKYQVNLLRVAVHDKSDTNARPIQNLNGRNVQLFGSKESNKKN